MWFNLPDYPSGMMLPYLLLSTYLSLTVAELLQLSNDCIASIDYRAGKVKDSLPLILAPNLEKEFLYPQNDTRTLRIPRGKSIRLACPGKNNYLQSKGAPKEAIAICVKDQIFNIDGVPRNFSSLTCKQIPQHDTRRLRSPCLKQYSSIEIGFQLNNTFLPTISVCRDEKTYTTLYTKFELSKNIGSLQIGYPRPLKWWAGEYFPGLDINQLYRFETQLDTIARILNSTELAKQHLKKAVQYISRGHLTARADFIYGTQQRATFWFINVAPQWQSFNGGNWNNLEDAVRQFAANRRLDLDVYTGVHGQMTMKDARGRQQPIHMHFSKKQRALPVPKFFWKIVYDPLSKRGIAFVGLNDPFIKSITSDIYICNDISSTIKWIPWKPNDINKGVSYVCRVNDLRKVIKNIPVLDVVGLLI